MGQWLEALKGYYHRIFSVPWYRLVGQWLRVCIQDSNPANVLITMTLRSLDYTFMNGFLSNY